MKKLLALLLSALMAMSLLAACGSDISSGDAQLPPGTVGGEETTAPASAFTTGELTVNAGAAFVITFDAEGLVLRIDGADENYKDFLDFLGEDSALISLSCADVLAEIIKSAGVKGYLDNAGYVAIKQDPTGNLPDEAFLDAVQRSAQKALDAAAPEVALVMITASQQNADGQIDLPTAKTLVQKFLRADSLTNFDSNATPIGGMYGVTAGVDGQEEQLLVNAVTCSVDYGILESQADGTESTEEPDDTDVPEDTVETTAPAEENPVEETPADTTAAENND